MLKEHYATHNEGFSGISKKFNMAGVSGKLKSLIEYIQWKRLEQAILTEPPEIQDQLSPYIHQHLQTMK